MSLRADWPIDYLKGAVGYALSAGLTMHDFYHIAMKAENSRHLDRLVDEAIDLRRRAA